MKRSIELGLIFALILCAAAAGPAAAQDEPMRECCLDACRRIERVNDAIVFCQQRRPACCAAVRGRMDRMCEYLPRLVGLRDHTLEGNLRLEMRKFVGRCQEIVQRGQF
jgi:hypothetical protein